MYLSKDTSEETKRFLAALFKLIMINLFCDAVLLYLFRVT